MNSIDAVLRSAANYPSNNGSSALSASQSSTSGLSSLALAGNTSVNGSSSYSSGSSQSWYEAMAKAWGQALDSQANSITALSNQVSNGSDQPSQITELTAASLRFSFVSSSASTSTNAIGQALETLGRKE